jgi:hypothetical protein
VVLIPLVAKEIGCSGEYCTEILRVASPDDEHTSVVVERRPNEDVIEREYKCPKGHVTKVYWHQSTFVEI